MNEILLNNTSLPILCSCDLYAAAEPFYHADRTLPFHVLIYVAEGAIYVTEEDVDYAINPGELLFLKSGVHHFGRKEIPKGTRWYFMHFYFAEQPDLPAFAPDNSPITQNIPLGYTAALPKKLTGLTDSDIEKAIAGFTEYFHSDDTMKKWLVNTRFHALLGKIAFYEKFHVPSPTLSDKICAYLNLHFREPYSAEALECVFFLSYKHLAATFRKEKHMTMQQYHTTLRMNEACRLLKSTLLPIGEISEQIGFTDMLYFSRRFHAFAGMSPTEYRKSAPDYY